MRKDNLIAKITEKPLGKKLKECQQIHELFPCIMILGKTVVEKVYKINDFWVAKNSIKIDTT